MYSALLKKKKTNKLQSNVKKKLTSMGNIANSASGFLACNHFRMWSVDLPKTGESVVVVYILTLLTCGLCNLCDANHLISLILRGNVREKQVVSECAASNFFPTIIINECVAVPSDICP